MPSIDNAYIWAVNTCNAPRVGYSQAYRNQQTVNGITYYDCSSFIWYALIAGGFALTGDPFTTGSMRAILIGLGFVSLPIQSTIWMPGDIVWRPGHTEMVYQGVGVGDGYTMGAHSARLPLADQVSVSSQLDSAKLSHFTELYRYGSGGSGQTTYQWIRGGNSEYFDDAKMQNNAACLYQFFYAKGWTINAVAALCGNIQQESTFNPDLIEIGGTGHGLVQWTPPTDLYNVLDWLYGNHTDWGDPNGQCEAIYAEYQKTIGEIPIITTPDFDKQWYPTTAYPISWYDWAHSTDDPGELALAFQQNYERPAVIHPERAEYARNWYNFLLTVDPYGNNPGYQKSGLKIWQMIRYHL